MRVAGISTQPLLEQRAFAARNGIPFPLLSDELLGLQRAWSLPTFTAGAKTFLERMVLYVECNELRGAMYPVENPGASAEAVLRWLDAARFANPSQAFEFAEKERLARLERRRFAEECAKLDPEAEKALADHGLQADDEAWPEY
jgi:hypothetical protein